MHVIGIDENGLGLTGQAMTGPLVVTATGFKIEEDSFPIKPPFCLNNKILVCDSKDLFKSVDRKSSSMKSYRLGETTSLSFLSLLEDKVPKNFDEEILRKILINSLPCNLKEKHCFFGYPLNLPVWIDFFSKNLVTYLKKKLQEKGVKFTYCKCALLCPHILYKKDKYRQESYAMGQIISDWMETKVKGEEHIILLGRIKNYKGDVIKKWWKEFCFSFDTKNVRFITKGDKTEFPISLSSIIGKYIREIFIERINNYFRQFDPKIPLISGYRQNKSFDIFIEKAKIICNRENIPLSCLVRDYNTF